MGTMQVSDQVIGRKMKKRISLPENAADQVVNTVDHGLALDDQKENTVGHLLIVVVDINPKDISQATQGIVVRALVIGTGKIVAHPCE